MEKILGFIKWLFECLVKFWNIYGGIIIATLIAWWSGYSKDKMDKTTSYIILLFTIISLLTYVKKERAIRKSRKNLRIDNTSTNKNKPKMTLVEKVSMAQPTVKAINTALDPLATGEELGGTIIETADMLERLGKIMKTKIANFFKRVWGNKFTLMNIFANLLVVAVADFLTFSEYLKRFEIFTKNELAFKIGVPIISAIYLIIDIYTTVTKYGWETLGELKTKAEEKAEAKASALSPEQRSVLKTQVKCIKNAISDYNQQIKAFDEIISNVQVLNSLGITISPDKQTEYVNAMNTKTSILTTLEQLEKELERLTELLNK